MATQKRKFELYSRLGELGFSYEEAVQLRRIEMTLSRWAEAECNGEIERNEEKGGRPERVSQAWINGATDKRSAWPIADREAGALRRLKAIVDARNERIAPMDRSAMLKATLKYEADGMTFKEALAKYEGLRVHAYHQTDPRGCSLYIVPASSLPDATDEQMERHSGKWPLKSEETRLQWKLSCYYTRGLAVCA